MRPKRASTSSLLATEKIQLWIGGVLIAAGVCAALLVSVHSFEETSQAAAAPQVKKIVPLPSLAISDSEASANAAMKPASAPPLSISEAGMAPAADVSLAQASSFHAAPLKKLHSRIAQLQRRRRAAQDRYLRICRLAALGRSSEDEKIVAAVKLDLIAAELRDARESLAWTEPGEPARSPTSPTSRSGAGGPGNP